MIVFTVSIEDKDDSRIHKVITKEKHKPEKNEMVVKDDESEDDEEEEEEEEDDDDDDDENDDSMTGKLFW